MYQPNFIKQIIEQRRTRKIKKLEDNLQDLGHQIQRSVLISGMTYTAEIVFWKEQ